MTAIIGITCGFDEAGNKYYLRPGYWESIAKAGGTPIILPPLCSPEAIGHYLEVCDGYILSGGDDLDPAFWGEDPEPGLGEIDPIRDKFEIELVQRIVEMNKPALFICRGMQVLNVALGGDLIQDLKSDMSHRQRAPRYHPFHDILVEKTSNLYHLFKQETVKVNSYHHQAIRNLAEGLIVTARARDGVVEAVEHSGKRWMMGVQWHPEAMRDELSARLFKGLVEAAVEGN